MMKNPLAILGPLVEDVCFTEVGTLTRSRQEKASTDKGVMLRFLQGGVVQVAVKI